MGGCIAGDGSPEAGGNTGLRAAGFKGDERILKDQIDFPSIQLALY